VSHLRKIKLTRCFKNTTRMEGSKKCESVAPIDRQDWSMSNLLEQSFQPFLLYLNRRSRFRSMWKKKIGEF